MTIADTLTTSRLVLSPVFFIAYFAPQWFGLPPLIAVVLLWAFGFVIEVSDLLDGMLARRLNQGTDVGKFLDPYADVISRCTYFICFAFTGIMPLWLLVIILYREISISFIRLLILKKGIVMGAKAWGKLKAWSYTIAGTAGMIVYSIKYLGGGDSLYRIFHWIAFGVFCIAAFAAIVSLFGYIRELRRASIQ